MSSQRLFINYRAEDTGPTASALYRDLERVLEAGQVFLDHERLTGGDVWPQRLKDEVAASTVMLSLIGSKWLTLHDPRTGDRRLNVPSDWVRRELEVALEEGKVIVPVLVDAANPLPVGALLTVPSIERFATLQRMFRSPLR